MMNRTLRIVLYLFSKKIKNTGDNFTTKLERLENLCRKSDLFLDGTLNTITRHLINTNNILTRTKSLTPKYLGYICKVQFQIHRILSQVKQKTLKERISRK